MTTPEEEFNQIYSSLASQLPRTFNSGRAKGGAFFVSEEFDGDLIASFLMTWDEYNIEVPRAIQNFLRPLHYEWTVFGSFDIASPFNPDGTVNPSPRFVVTRDGISGDYDINSVTHRFGAQLKSSTK